MTKILDKNGNIIKPKAVSKGRSINNTGAIIDKIIQQFKDRSRKDIDKWRTALVMAENKDKPRRDLLFAIFDDLRTDGHLESQITLRKTSILNTEFQIINQSGDIDEEKTRLIRSKWFYDILEILAETAIYGHSLIEFINFEDTKITTVLIPRGNVVPVKQYVIPDLSKVDEVIYYNTPQFEQWLIEFGKPDDLGIFNKIVPNLIWKRNMLQSWAEFAEKFGIPLVTATTQRYDDDTLDKVEEMLGQLGEASYAVFPEGTVLEMKEADRGDASGIYDKMIERNNGEISKAITGSTMIADNGSSRSQAEVHERNLNERIAPAERRNIEFLINEQLLPLLAAHGYPFAETDVFTFNHQQSITIKEQWDITKELLATHEIPEEWISKTFSIPITGKKKVATKMPENALNIKGLNLPNYIDGKCPNCGGTTEYFSAVVNNAEIKRLENQLWEALYNNSNEDYIIQSKLVVTEATQFLKALREGWGKRALEVAYTEPDVLAMSLMELNIYDFAISKTEARLAIGEGILVDKEKLRINSFNEFKRLAQKKTNNFNESWLKTEYNLAVATGQTSAAYFRALSEKDHIPYVQYLTAGDSNVRNTHRQLDGKIFKIDEASKVWPPNDYGCRCTMEQYPHTPDKTDITNADKGINLLGGESYLKSSFKTNRAISKKIFTNEQMYAPIDALRRKLNDINYEHFNLKPYSKIRKNYKEINLSDSITEKNYKELFRNDGILENENLMYFKDYSGRNIAMKERTFKTHTKPNSDYWKDKRHLMFSHINTVIQNPDEVWLHLRPVSHKTNYEHHQQRYIKFYKQFAFIVDVSITDNGLIIKSWNKMNLDLEKDRRKGLLLKIKKS